MTPLEQMRLAEQVKKDRVRSVQKIVVEIDELVSAANPDDGSAPLGPVVQMGNLLNNKWPTIRAILVAYQ